MKLIHMSDLHLVKPGERLWGLNPYTRLEVALHDIARHHGDADLCVITGDLADGGSIEGYQALRELLERFPIRTALLLGSHDNRENYYHVFPEAPRDPSGFAQFAEITHQGLFIFLDTVGDYAGPGLYCEARQAWLAGLLAEYRDVPVYLFAHHPPFDLGIPQVDHTRLANPGQFAGLLTQNAVHHLFFGHAHRATVCTWQGILCSGVPGIGYQFPLVEGSVTSPFSVEPPMYAVVRIEDEGTLINFDTFMHRHSADMRGYVAPPPREPLAAETMAVASVAALYEAYDHDQVDEPPVGSDPAQLDPVDVDELESAELAGLSDEALDTELMAASTDEADDAAVEAPGEDACVTVQPGEDEQSAMSSSDEQAGSDPHQDDDGTSNNHIPQPDFDGDHDIAAGADQRKSQDATPVIW